MTEAGKSTPRWVGVLAVVASSSLVAGVVSPIVSGAVARREATAVADRALDDKRRDEDRTQLLDVRRKIKVLVDEGRLLGDCSYASGSALDCGERLAAHERAREEMTLAGAGVRSERVRRGLDQLLDEDQALVLPSETAQQALLDAVTKKATQLADTIDDELRAL